MPYARAPGRSVTAATSVGTLRDSPGAAIGHEAAWYQGAPHRPAALAAPTPLEAGAALGGHRRVRRPSIGRLPPIDAGATVVQLTPRSEEHTSELQSPCNLVCRLLLEKKKKTKKLLNANTKKNKYKKRE